MFLLTTFTNRTRKVSYIMIAVQSADCLPTVSPAGARQQLLQPYWTGSTPSFAPPGGAQLDGELLSTPPAANFRPGLEGAGPGRGG